MEIRTFKEEDIELMEDVLIDDNMSFDKENLKKFIADQNSHGFIVKENENVIGFAYAYTLRRPDGKIMFYLHSVGILPNYQGQGYGYKLFEFIKTYSIRLGCSEMFVITDKGNQIACHIYEKLGGENDIPNEIVYVFDYLK